MGWFEINTGTTGGGTSGGGTGGGTTTTPAPKNFQKAGFNFVGAQGKVLQAVNIDNNYTAAYRKVYSATDIGQNGIRAHFTGDHTYAARSLDSFQVAVKDPNGNGLTESVLGTVNKIVAGGGIYISAPNGQDTVTISTEPLNLKPFLEDLYDVNWTVSVPDANGKLPYGVPGQFTAVGANGAILRSRDGHNWVEMYPNTSTTIYSVTSEIGNHIPENHMEYCGVGQDPITNVAVGLYGVLGGTNGDSFTEIGVLTDQDGPIVEGMAATIIVPMNPLLEELPELTQFTGGLTEYSINSRSGSTSTGVPIFDVLADIMTYYKMEPPRLKRANTVPTLVFSKSGNDGIYIDMRLIVSEPRYSPTTSISTHYPYIRPKLLDADNNGYPDNIQNGVVYGLPAYPGGLAVTSYGVSFFPNGTTYFTPYCRVTINGIVTSSAYLSLTISQWTEITLNQASFVTQLGSAGSQTLGSKTLKLEYWWDGTMTSFDPDYVYTATYLVGP